MRMISTCLLLALALAGCAQSGPGDGVATAGGPGTSATTSASTGPDPDGPFKYSKCVRENGVPDFPDPKTDGGGGFSLAVPEGVDKSKVDAAHEKCKHLMPNGGEPQKASPEAIEEGRRMAQCMRENGFPDFPDPDANGGIAIQGGPGLDPKDPKFQEAEKKCAPQGGGTHQRNDG